MAIYRVSAEIQKRCGGEDFVYVVFAEDEADAKLQVLRAVDKDSTFLEPGTSYDYEIEEIEAVNTGVIRVSHWEWYR